MAAMQWKDATIVVVVHKKKVRTECGNYRGVSAGSAYRQDAAEDHRSPPR